MNDVLITAENLDEALQEAGERFSVPLYALEYEQVSFNKDDLLIHAEEPEGLSIRVWVRPDYLAEQSRGHLVRLLEVMCFEGQVDESIYANMIHLEISSADNNAQLIGHRGETLEAMEYLVNRMLSRGGGIAPPVIVDVQNYRLRKIRQIENMAKQKAAEAIRTQQEAELEPMDSRDRKIIHAILGNFKGVKTFSRGLDEDRRVIVAPDGTEADPEQLSQIRQDNRGGQNRHSRRDQSGRRDHAPRGRDSNRPRGPKKES